MAFFLRNSCTKVLVPEFKKIREAQFHKPEVEFLFVLVKGIRMISVLHFDRMTWPSRQ